MAFVGLALLVCLGVVLTRAFVDGRAALAAGDAAVTKDVREAIADWRRAARWYVPGAPHVSGAYDRLEMLATQAEQANDLDTALEAWRAIRSSSLATRSFYTPYADRLARANEKIAALMAQQEVRAAPPGTKDASERQAWHLALLQKDEAPSVAWSILALLGFATWIGGGFLFAWRGLTADDKLDARKAGLAGILVAVGLLVWMISLYRA
jgi:hypothetical protein